MDIIEALPTRRSIKSFLTKAVDWEKLLGLVDLLATHLTETTKL